jgi:hypothetical protein
MSTLLTLCPCIITDTDADRLLHRKSYYKLHAHNEDEIRFFVKVKVKVKQSRYRPGVAQRVPGSLGSQIS